MMMHWMRKEASMRAKQFLCFNKNIIEGEDLAQQNAFKPPMA